MAILYVDSSTGSDNNSGAPFTAIANGTAATRAAAVYTLDGSPDLSGVTVNEDTIRIVGETSGNGSTGDTFTITAVDDGADTVTVSPTPTGGTSGLSWYLGGAHATIQRGMNSVDAGDTLYIKASGTYNEDISYDTYGLVDSRVTIEGYTTTPGDGGRVTISGTTNCLTLSTATNYYVIFKGLNFTGCSDSGVLGIGTDRPIFYNCKFHNNGGYGVRLDNTCTFINCEAYGNTFYGFDVDTEGVFIGCIAHTNGSVGIHTDGGSARDTLFYKNLCYNNVGSALSCGGRANYIANTIDGDNVGTADGINLAGNARAYVIDNVIHDCDEGVRGTGTLTDALIFNNCLSQNTTDYNVVGPASPKGLNDVTTADPKFIDEANDDYNLQHQSPAASAGIKPGCTS